jgi:PAS domain S-box-containing protein
LGTKVTDHEAVKDKAEQHPFGNEHDRAAKILNALNEACYELDSSGAITYVNRKAEELFKIKKHELLGRNIWEVFPKSKNTLCWDAIQLNALDKKLFSQYEYVSSVTHTCISLRATPTDEGCIVLFHEIENIKETRHQLKESNDLLRGIFELSPDLINIQEYPSLKIIYHNHKIFNGFEYSMDEMAVQTAEQRHKLIHPDSLASLKEYYDSFENLFDHDITSCEYRAKGRADEWIWMRARGKVFGRDDSGKVICILNIVQEISEQKMAEQEIKEYTHFSNRMIDLIPDVLGLLDLHTLEFTYFNKELFVLLGYTPEEIENLPPGQQADFIHPDDREAVKKYNERWLTLKDGEENDVEFRALKKNGELLWMHSRGKIFSRDNEGKATRAIMTVRNITGSKKVEQELIEKNKQLQHTVSKLESFNYIASHDLQEPLRKIQTYANLINSGRPPEDVMHYIASMNNSAMRMSALIQSLLDYSRLSLPHDALQSTDLNKILDDVKKDFEIVLKKKGAIIYCDALPVVRAIPFQMYQLFSNLISNSLKFSEKRPEIKITSRTVKRDAIPIESESLLHKHFLEIKFYDNGIGFDNKYNKKIFEVFQRLNSISKYNGTGIGLSITDKIVKNYHGVITAESEEGKGSVFTIYLPASMLSEF